jgi:dolichol-phosphate mannosyltransferase
MSGFFTIRRDRLVELAPRLSGIGYKILLDIMSLSRTPLKVSEHPYIFRTRQHGESKFDAMVVLNYLEMLIEKRVGGRIPIKFLKFGAVWNFGIARHISMLSLMLRSSVSFTAAQTIAVFSAMTFNFLLNNSFTYRDRRLKGFACWAACSAFT